MRATVLRARVARVFCADFRADAFIFRFGEASATAILLLLVLTVVAVGYLWLSRREEVA